MSAMSETEATEQETTNGDSETQAPEGISEGPASLRELLERMLLAALGAVALTRDRAEELAEELAERGSMSRDEAREAIDDVTGRWRHDATRLGERAGSSLGGVFRDVGVVPRRDYEELELRLAQLEHRLKLLEKDSGSDDEQSGSA